MRPEVLGLLDMDGTVKIQSVLKRYEKSVWYGGTPATKLHPKEYTHDTFSIFLIFIRISLCHKQRKF
jgi:hypothetical protein